MSKTPMCLSALNAVLVGAALGLSCNSECPAGSRQVGNLCVRSNANTVETGSGGLNGGVPRAATVAGATAGFGGIVVTAGTGNASLLNTGGALAGVAVTAGKRAETMAEPAQAGMMASGSSNAGAARSASVSTAPKPICGNGVREAAELCDGADCPSECKLLDACLVATLIGSVTTCDAHCSDPM